MLHTIRNGWLQGVKKIPSPNFDQRPADTEIDVLVIHNISLPPGQFGTGYVQQLFCNQLDCTLHPYFERLIDLRVSSHCLIERDGVLVQFVSFNDRAWHAGESSFKGRVRCNDFAIGIELEGTDHQPYTDNQYEQLATVTKHIMRTYPRINVDSIVGHSDIAPQRKTDPGPAFDWSYYRSLLS